MKTNNDNTPKKVVLQAPTFEEAIEITKKNYDEQIRVDMDLNFWMEDRATHFGGKQYD